MYAGTVHGALPERQHRFCAADDARLLVRAWVDDTGVTGDAEACFSRLHHGFIEEHMHTTPRYIGPVATVVDPTERADVERAGAGLYRTVHRDSVAEVLRDLREKRVSAILLSSTRCTPAELSPTRRVVREFPRVPALVLLSAKGIPSAADLIAIGQCGVHQVIDVRTPSGWARLRGALARDVVRERDQLAMRELLDELAGAPKDLITFAEALFDGYTGARTVQALARGLGVLPTTLVSRFFRARLPAPKQYLVYAGLVRAARLFENSGLTIADVSTHLGHSSPQSFGRHIQTYMRMSAGEFRRKFDGVKMMRRFREELITPYRDRLIAMAPLTMRGRAHGCETASELMRAS